MDLFVAKTRYGPKTTTQLGRYEIVNGFFGPAPKHVITQFLGIENGNMLKVGKMRELLLVFDLVQPETDEDLAYLKGVVERLQKRLSGIPDDLSAVEVPENFEFPTYDEMLKALKAANLKHPVTDRALRPKKEDVQKLFYLLKR